VAVEPSRESRRRSSREPRERVANGPGPDSTPEIRSAVADVDLAALAHNAREAQRLAGSRELICVVKADGYGHGAVPVARTLLAAGARRLAVLTVDEAVALRDQAVESPILLMRGVFDGAEAREAVGRRLTPVVHDADGLERAAAAASPERPLPIHVEVDTGMRRMGVQPDRAPALLERAASLPAVKLEGVFTHFASADEPDLAPSLEQIGVFRRVLEQARQRGVQPALVHIANSAGLLVGDVLSRALPEANAVRPGLMLYGACPAPHLDAADLRPVMTVRAPVAAVQRLASGDAVGYGATWRTEAAGWAATLVLGYADGVPWTASNAGQVWLAGARRPFVGRVSMDYTSVRVDEGSVQVGDQAVFFGATDGGRLPVEEAADRAGTLAYELLVRVGSRVPRRFHPVDEADLGAV
jgi:alanine racemase